MALYGISPADVAATILAPEYVDRDSVGNLRYWRQHGVHPYIRVILAGDDAHSVKSVHPRRRLPKEP
jgi:hypothetical protein